MERKINRVFSFEGFLSMGLILPMNFMQFILLTFLTSLF